MSKANMGKMFHSSTFCKTPIQPIQGTQRYTTTKFSLPISHLPTVNNTTDFKRMMKMNKRTFLSSIGLFLSIALLVGAFLVTPKPSLAKAPYTPISVTQIGQCAQLASLFNTQTCVMNVTTPHDLTHPIHFSVSTTAVGCFQGTCRKETPATNYVQAIPTSGNTLQYASNAMPILLIDPLSLDGGYEAFTFVVCGPSNCVTRTLRTTSEGN